MSIADCQFLIAHAVLSTTSFASLRIIGNCQSKIDNVLALPYGRASDNAYFPNQPMGLPERST
ncbi:MAG TPA: hypothetical protein VFU37_20695, partial [Pyrinomonadaceae bacterium]|nr:hypothetical protein [Pyrinomonadaceae bacterium]